MKLLFATSNAGKLGEVKKMLAPLGWKAIGLKDLPNPPVIVEDEETFLGNARKKALTLHVLTGLSVLADDTGLTVDALGGAPGVRSARYAGEDATDAENNEKLLRELSGMGEGGRGAAFECWMVFIRETGEESVAKGILRGRILREPRGSQGFGYDPLFVPEGSDKTLAEMSLEEKNAISHRKKALEGILKTLR